METDAFGCPTKAKPSVGTDAFVRPATLSEAKGSIRANDSYLNCRAERINEESSAVLIAKSKHPCNRRYLVPELPALLNSVSSAYSVL